MDSPLILEVDLVEIRRSILLALLSQLELHEGVTVGPQLPDHVLLEQQVVSGCQMVVLIVLDGLQQTFPVEALLGL